MQTVSRYLISNNIIVYQSGYNGRNSKVYDRTIKLFRGVNNPITFTFKNEDQKRQNVVGKTYQFNLVDTQSKKAVITRTLTILDDGSTVSTKGTAKVEITEGDLLDLEAKFYSYSINEVLSDGSTLVTYADTSYVSSGTAEILDGAYAQFVASTVIDSFTANDGPLTKTSSSINANPGKNNNSALHTVAMYGKNFAGRVRIQGTMDTSPQNADYFDITSVDFTTSDSVKYININGVYQYIRFSWGNNSGNSGRIDKILYRQ